jgi:hypothetical protein
VDAGAVLALYPFRPLKTKCADELSIDECTQRKLASRRNDSSSDTLDADLPMLGDRLTESVWLTLQRFKSDSRTATARSLKRQDNTTAAQFPTAKRNCVVDMDWRV